MSALPESVAVRLTLGEGTDDRVLAFRHGRPVTLAQFHGQVRALAVRLPAGRHAVNLCEDRYLFLVALCAVALRGQTTLLPPSRAPEVVAEIMALHAESYALGDAVAQPGVPHYWPLPQPLAACEGPRPQVPAQALAVIGYTSGSTGRPKAYPKTWEAFQVGCRQNLLALEGLWDEQAPASVLATVPPQHMYGMEMSVILPLLGGVAIDDGRPMFPQDVAHALAALPAPRLLVTTPVHLRVLVDSGVEMPALAGMVSATAPLPVELARSAEACFGGQMREVFGSTETCIFARRRTAVDDAWTLLPEVTLACQPDGTLVHAPHLPVPILLADLVELLPGGRFVLRGRQADLLEIAGKRASLADLTRRLLAVPGVVDGLILQLDPDDAGVRRIAALVVAPGLDEATLLAALRQAMDPVFLPRRLRFVPALPRADTGKLPRAGVLRLLQD
ncbi:MAG TPA: AMP-binding protein [Stenotrophomonas sp.]|jgi:acyl-coenzyme A synthetase/AMP-(fatty) acid ligase